MSMFLLTQVDHYKRRLRRILYLRSALLLLVTPLLVTAGCPAEEPTAPITPRSPFDGAAAYQDLEKVVAFGPRISGSDALANLRAFLKAELAKEEIPVREHAFSATTPIGEVAMVSLIATIEGTEPGIIVLGNHYETKLFERFEFVGANDAGSSTAWMLEFARAIGKSREGRTVWLVWFDGEEAFEDWGPDDSLYGSRAFVAHLQDTGELSKVDAMVNVDMIGDCGLGISHDGGAPSWLNDAIWASASQLGYGAFFKTSSRTIEDDHIPFRQAGVPAIDIIDFSYGPLNSYWHSSQDTLENVCADSLQIVGDVIYHALPRIEAKLDE